MKAIIEIDCFSSYLCNAQRIQFVDFLQQNFMTITTNAKTDAHASKDIFNYLFLQQELESKYLDDYTRFKNSAMKLYDGYPNIQTTTCDLELNKGLALDKRVKSLSVLKAKFLRIIKDDVNEIKISNNDRDD